MFARKTLRSLVEIRPDLEGDANRVLQMVTRGSVTRGLGKQVPVDNDSRLKLLRIERSPLIEPEPVWVGDVQKSLELVLAERRKWDVLLSHGLSPTKSMLFVGPPGVGKTLAARWVARELDLPLLTLDLAAVMSSFLGRTGNNLRTVLDFASHESAVLLLDEFDAIAKRRDDATEIGELKRLVTVILQSVDDWPAGQLLIAASNHPELLDPAIWRRFDQVVKFPLPSTVEIRKLIGPLLEPIDVDDMVVKALAEYYAGLSFSDVVTEIRRTQREAVVQGVELVGLLVKRLAGMIKGADRPTRKQIVIGMVESGLSQRKVAELTGLARATVGVYVRDA